MKGSNEKYFASIAIPTPYPIWVRGDSDDGLKALADAIELEIENDEEADFLSGKGACIADKAIAYGAEELEKNGITLETIGDDIDPPRRRSRDSDQSILDCITASDVAEGIMQEAKEEGEPISMEAASLLRRKHVQRRMASDC